MLWLVTERLPVGRNLYVIGANVRAAELTGINVRRHVIGAFVASGLLRNTASPSGTRSNPKHGQHHGEEAAAGTSLRRPRRGSHRACKRQLPRLTLKSWAGKIPPSAPRMRIAMRLRPPGSEFPPGMDKLSVELQSQLDAVLEPISFAAGQVLQRAGERTRHCHFIDSGLVSLIWPAGSGALIEVGMAGPQGLSGVSAILHPSTSPYGVRALSDGKAWRAEVEPLRARIATSEPLRDLLQQHACAVLEQSYELAACAAQHSLEQRLARWIFVASYHLGGRDGADHPRGTRRAAQCPARQHHHRAHHLEGERAIFSLRGSIHVRDASILERCSCGCHRVSELGQVANASGGHGAISGSASSRRPELRPDRGPEGEKLIWGALRARMRAPAGLRPARITGGLASVAGCRPAGNSGSCF